MLALYRSGRQTEALELYRTGYQPSERYPEPRTFLTVNAVVAETADEAERRALPNLLTMVAREAIHRAYEESLRAAYGVDVFTAVVPRAPLFKESIAGRKPIAQYKPKSAPAKAMAALADELRARIAGSSDLLAAQKKEAV